VFGALSNPPTIWCDNIGTTYLASNPMVYVRTKNVEIYYYFVRERVISKQLQIQFLCSKDQIADIMTKALTTQFVFLHDKLIVASAPLTCWGCKAITGKFQQLITRVLFL
jgi:hypothetical protein